jgi:hypothetical protein
MKKKSVTGENEKRIPLIGRVTALRVTGFAETGAAVRQEQEPTTFLGHGTCSSQGSQNPAIGPCPVKLKPVLILGSVTISTCKQAT